MKPKAHGIPLLLLSAAISQVTHAATAASDSATTLVNTPVIINVLANDTTTGTAFVDGGDGVFFAAYGDVVVNNDNTLTYTPNTDYVGSDSFDYFVFDDSGYSDSATVFVTVTEGQATADLTGLEDYVPEGSAKDTATMITNFCAGTGKSASLVAACQAFETALEESTPEEIAAAIQNINPEEILAQRQAISGMSKENTNAIYQNQMSLRGAGASGLAFNGRSLMMNSYNGGTAGENATPWGVFGSVHIDKADRSQSANEAGYEADAYGLLLGVNYQLRSDLHVGGAFDWSTTDLEYDDDAGDMNSDLYSLTGYVSWLLDSFTVDMQLGYAIGDISSERNVGDGNAKGDTDSAQYSLSTQVDWTYSRKALTLRPYLRVDYLNIQVDKFSETGSSAWLMNVGNQDVDLVTTSLGLDTSYAFGFDWGVFVPGFKGAINSDTSTDFSSVSFSLVGDSGSNSEFTLDPDSQENVFYEWEINSVFVLKNGMSVFVAYQFISGYDYLDAAQITGGFNFEM